MPTEILEAFSKRTRQVEAYEQILLVAFRERKDGTRLAGSMQRSSGRRPPTPARPRPARRSPIWRCGGARKPPSSVGLRGSLTQELTNPRARAAGARARHDRAGPRPAVGPTVDVGSAPTCSEPSATSPRCIPVSTDRGGRARLSRAVSAVVDTQQDLDPPRDEAVRRSDGRSVWMDPSKAHLTDARILEQEGRILDFAVEARADSPTRSDTVDRAGLDVLQADAAAAVAGIDRLVLVVGPAGTGKTTTLARATDDLRQPSRTVFGRRSDGQGRARPRDRDGHESRHRRQAPVRVEP